MKGFTRWAIAVFFTALAGGALGWTLGASLSWLDRDQMFLVRHFAAKGLRAGLLIGTFLGACAVVGQRESARASHVLLGGVAISLSVVAASLAAAAAAYVLGRAGMISLPREIGRQVGHPYRLLFCYGLQWGAVAGAAVGGLGGGVFLWRSRARRRDSNADNP